MPCWAMSTKTVSASRSQLQQVLPTINEASYLLVSPNPSPLKLPGLAQTSRIIPHQSATPSPSTKTRLQNLSKPAASSKVCAPLHCMKQSWRCRNRTRSSPRWCLTRILPPPNARQWVEDIGQGSHKWCWLLSYLWTWLWSVLERDKCHYISWYLFVHRRKARSSGWIWKHVA